MSFAMCHVTFITALDYIQYLQSQSSRHENQLLKLQREVKALRIMKE